MRYALFVSILPYPGNLPLFIALSVVEAAIQLLQAKPDDEILEEDSQEYIDVWNAISQRVNTLKEHWANPAVDYAWMAISNVFPWMRICIWQVGGEKHVPVNRQECGTGVDGEVMNLLYFACGYAHYDLLVGKKVGRKLERVYFLGFTCKI